MRVLGYLILAVLLGSCEQKNCCTSAEASSLNGNWEFVRVFYGFTGVTQTATEAGYTERLEIDGKSMRLIRFKDGKRVENTRFELSEQGNSKVITFEEEQTYSYYTVFQEDGKTMLSLYQRSPVGAQLADGGTYYYEKQ